MNLILIYVRIVFNVSCLFGHTVINNYQQFVSKVQRDMVILLIRYHKVASFKQIILSIEQWWIRFRKKTFLFPLAFLLNMMMVSWFIFITREMDVVSSLDIIGSTQFIVFGIRSQLIDSNKRKNERKRENVSSFLTNQIGFQDIRIVCLYLQFSLSLHEHCSLQCSQEIWSSCK